MQPLTNAERARIKRDVRRDLDNFKAQFAPRSLTLLGIAWQRLYYPLFDLYEDGVRGRVPCDDLPDVRRILDAIRAANPGLLLDEPSSLPAVTE